MYTYNFYIIDLNITQRNMLKYAIIIVDLIFTLQNSPLYGSYI